MAEVTAFATTMGIIGARLPRMKVEIIGGHVTTGDLLFVNSLEVPIDLRLSHLSIVVPQMEDVVRRLGKEFPEMTNSLAGLAAKYPDRFTNP
jgi:hypothetical protein